MRVDQGSADGNAGDEAEIGGGIGGEAGAEGRRDIDDARSDAGEVVRCEVAEADRLEIAPVPAALVREIGPFAGDGADGALGRAGRAEGEEVR